LVHKGRVGCGVGELSFVLCLKLFADLSCGKVSSQKKGKLGNV